MSVWISGKLKILDYNSDLDGTWSKNLVFS